MTDTPLRTVLRILTPLAAMLVAAALAFGFLGRFHPIFDAFSHFRVHFAAILLGLAVVLAFARLRLHAFVATVLAVGSFITVSGSVPLPGLGTAQAAFSPAPSDQPVYKLLQLNLRFDNDDPNSVIRLIGRVRPDVITLDEVSSMWSEKLNYLAAGYPYRVLCRSTALLSRRPFVRDAEPLCLPGERFASARVDFGGRVVDVAAIHLRWPWPYGQASHLDRLAQPIAQLGETALLAGDFNAAPWSASMKRVEAMGQLSQIDGIGATWLAERLPRWLQPAGLPIDHVLAKGDIYIHAARTLDPVGSDHWPVLVEFSLPLPEPEPDEAVASGPINTAL